MVIYKKIAEFTTPIGGKNKSDCEPIYLKIETALDT